MLSRIAREMTAEIASHDWSDAPYRLDRAGHQRRTDNKRGDLVLEPDQVDAVRINVAWVTCQVLKHADPNLDEHEYLAACGVPHSVTHRTDGSPSGFVTYGLRWADLEQKALMKPGAPLYRVRVQCEVANLVVFKRLLGLVDGFDPSEPPKVESVGGAMREVTVTVRDWEGETSAAERAVHLVSAASTSVIDGTAAVLIDVQ